MKPAPHFYIFRKGKPGIIKLSCFDQLKSFPDLHQCFCGRLSLYDIAFTSEHDLKKLLTEQPKWPDKPLPQKKENSRERNSLLLNTSTDAAQPLVQCRSTNRMAIGTQTVLSGTICPSILDVIS